MPSFSTGMKLCTKLQTAVTAELSRLSRGTGFSLLLLLNQEIPLQSMEQFCAPCDLLSSFEGYPLLLLAGQTSLTTRRLAEKVKETVPHLSIALVSFTTASKLSPEELFEKLEESLKDLVLDGKIHTLQFDEREKLATLVRAEEKRFLFAGLKPRHLG